MSFEKKARSLSSSFFQCYLCCGSAWCAAYMMPGCQITSLVDFEKAEPFFPMWKTKVTKASFLFCSNIRNISILYHIQYANVYSASILDGVNQTSWESETDFHQPFPHFGSVQGCKEEVSRVNLRDISSTPSQPKCWNFGETSTNMMI